MYVWIWTPKSVYTESHESFKKWSISTLMCYGWKTFIRLKVKRIPQKKNNNTQNIYFTLTDMSYITLHVRLPDYM